MPASGISLMFDTAPKAFQSVRFGKFGGYQTKEHKEWQAMIAHMARKLLPPDFKMFVGPLMVSLTYAFSPPGNMKKDERQRIILGEVVYRPKRPDLLDNLGKGLADALTGVVWKDDSLIVHVKDCVKIYAFKPYIHLRVWPVA